MSERTLEEERVIIGGFVVYFRECLEDGTPCEGDSDLSALWCVAARSPGVCANLMADGLDKLFSPDAVLPDQDTFKRARDQGDARFS